MALEDEVNEVWRRVGREVGARFAFTKSGRVESPRKGRGFGAQIYEARLVRSTDKGTFTLGYTAVKDIGSFGDENEFHTTTTMKVQPVGRPEQLVFSEQSTSNSIGFFRRLTADLVWDNWKLPILDHRRLVDIFVEAETADYMPAQLTTEEPVHADPLQQLMAAEIQRGRAKRPWLEKISQVRCAELLDLGVSARVLDRTPLPGEARHGWIEITDSQIRWAQVAREIPWTSRNPTAAIDFWVPDSRMEPDHPRVNVMWAPAWESTSRIPFRRPKSFPGRWMVAHMDPEDEYLWTRGAPGHLTIDVELSSQVADRLMDTIGRYWYVQSNLTHGYWTISNLFAAYTPADHDEALDRHFWASCEAIAEALLAMPIPSKD